MWTFQLFGKNKYCEGPLVTDSERVAKIDAIIYTTKFERAKWRQID